MPFKSQLFPGTYHIRNAHYKTHAVLHNDNEPTDLYSDILEGKDAGPVWRIKVLSNSMYALQNDNYKNYAIQNDGVGPGPTDSRIHASTHDDTLSRRAWRIEFVSAGQFVICDYKFSTCWELRHESPRTPLFLSAYVPGRQEQLWKFEKVGSDLSSTGIPGQGSVCRNLVLSMDGSGLYGMAGLVVLERIMQMLANDKDHPLRPTDVFELIGGASSGGLIAILLGRLGMDCATAWREYTNLLAHLSPVNHCDLHSQDNYALLLREIFKRYTEQRNARMETAVNATANSSRAKTVNTFVTTMQVRGVPRISCIRSYDAPRGNPDTALNYEWSILEAAMATCARHPYSLPVRIQDDIDLTTIIPCRDPSLMGHSNPIRLVAAEAGCLFDKADDEEKTPPVYISLGAGKPIEEEFSNAAKERPDAEQSVATMFHSIATREAEMTHTDLGTCFPGRSYFRLCPKLELDHTKVTQAHEIETATLQWLESREGRTQIRSLIECLLGVPLLTVPPAAPEGIAEGYNPVLDSERPGDIRTCLRDYRVVFLVDDAESMERYWKDVAGALVGVAQDTRGQDVNAFGLHFVRSNQRFDTVTSPSAIISAFQGTSAYGRSAVGNRLGQILEEQFNTIEAETREKQFAKVKPLYIIVLTTGDFPDYLQDTLANVGQQMSIRKLHPNSVKIQFVLVGRSQAGAAHLQDLHAFDPAHIVDIAPTFDDLNAGRLKYSMLSTLQPNTVATLAHGSNFAGSIPPIFPAEAVTREQTPEAEDVITPPTSSGPIINTGTNLFPLSVRGMPGNNNNVTIVESPGGRQIRFQASYTTRSAGGGITDPMQSFINPNMYRQF